MTQTRSAHWWSPALTLAERVAARREANLIRVGAASSSSITAANRLRRWRTQRPFDRAGFFTRRLELDRLTEPEFEALLDVRPEMLVISCEAPAWVEEIERADAIASEIAKAPHSVTQADETGLAPARAFVEPFATGAMGRLYRSARLITDTHPSAPFDALRATELFEPSLWAQLVARALKVIVLELHVARVCGLLVGETTQDRCAHFADLVRTGPLRNQIIEEYPVLVRLLVTCAQFWADASAEFLAHLTTDATVLQETFAAGTELGALSGVSGNAGDSHRHGRSVIVAEFSSGVRIVYKPRSLAVDQHFHELLAWINDRGQTPALRAIRTITSLDHGWAEYVTNAPCDTAEEVERFYERFGAYLAILHALNATDFHYENVIASGESPVLIDLEALFHPHGESPAVVGEPEWLGWAALQASVLRTGVLPYRVYDSEQSSGLDMSAVGGTGGQRTPNRFPVLVAAGTDEMRFERDFVQLPGSQNRPSLGGRPVDPIGFVDQVLSGFTRTYRILLAHRDDLLAVNGPIHRFAHDPIRVVLRPTRQYALLLSESNHPDVMRDALERDRLIDRLWVAVPNKPELAQIIQWEHADLTDGDVPLFTSLPSSRDLFSTHGPAVSDFFQRSGLSSSIERIEAMGADDLSRQQWVVQAALVGLLPSGHGDVLATPNVVASDARNAIPPSQDAALGAARLVAERLARLSLRQNGQVSWLGLTLVRDRDWVIQPVGSDLYGGSIGIAFFLAYLDHLLGHGESRAIAREVVDQATRRLSTTLDSLADGVVLPPTVLGAFGALGGAVYALAHIGALWNDDAVLDVADRATSLLIEHLGRDRHLDVIGGLAGFVMAAAALESVRPGGAGRSAVRAAARLLVERAEKSVAGLSWTTDLAASRPLTGMSHGASGMALALVTANRRCADESFVEAAIAAFGYERSNYDAQRFNWPDYRILDERSRRETPPVMWAWCHGAPGIGLARLAALGATSGPEVIGDLTLTLESTARYGFGSNDSLCHGDLGNLELLIRARELGRRGDWEPVLAAESSRLVARLGRGEWRCGIPGGVETPGLMTGLAGVGFGLLRIGAPDRIPSLLSLEAPRLAASARSEQ